MLWSEAESEQIAEPGIGEMDARSLSQALRRGGVSPLELYQSCREPGMHHVPSLHRGAGVRPAKGQGAPSVQTARRGLGWEAEGL